MHVRDLLLGLRLGVSMQVASQLVLDQSSNERVVAYRKWGVRTRLGGVASAIHNVQRHPRWLSASIFTPLMGKLAH